MKTPYTRGFERVKQRLGSILILVPIILLVILIYSPGLHGPYVLDDGENITQNRAVAIHDLSLNSLHHALTSNASGPLKRPLAALSFAINHYAAGGFDNSFPFKLVNLLIHLVNVALLYGLTLLLLRTPTVATSVPTRLQPYLAAAVAALWALHPLQLTTVLYVVQRMNSLSALFVLAGLFLFCRGRHLLASSPRHGIATMYTGIVLGTLLGAGAKENAILLPIFALTIEYTLFRRDRLTSATSRQLRWFYLLCVVVPVIAFVGYLLTHPEFVTNAYAERRFTLLERLMTQPRVLWFYLSLIVLPSTHRLGLFHDDIAVSTGLFSPITTLPAMAALLAILIFAVWKARQYPIASFATLWFLTGHLLESSIFGLEIAYEHRNYLPAYGILFAISYLYVWVNRRWNTHLRFIIAVSVIFTLGFATWTRAHTWKNTYSIVEADVTNHPESPRANELAARMSAFEKGDLPAAVRYSIQGLNVAPDEAGFHVNLHLFLAMLSSQIDQGMKSADMKHAKDADIHIDGLPSGVIATINNNHVQLDYPASTINTIEKLLESRPITVHTLASLEAVGRCIIEKPDICRRMTRQGLRWYAIAANNPVTTETYNVLILNNTAELYAHMSDYATAMTYIDRAIQALPDVLFYRLKKIGYLVKQGRLDEAQSLLASIDNIGLKNDPRYFTNRAMIESMQNMYTDAVQGPRRASSIRGHR